MDDDTYVAAVSPRSLKTEEASGAGRVLLLGSVSSIATDGEWAERGAQLKDPDRSAWDIGDWWASGDHLGYGARKKIIESPGWPGPKDARHCQNLASLARKFPEGSRYHEVPISHYQAVQGLPSDIAHALLADAEVHHWTVTQLRDARRKAAGENPCPLGKAAECFKQLRQKNMEIRQLRAELAECHRIIDGLRSQNTKHIIRATKSTLGLC